MKRGKIIVTTVAALATLAIFAGAASAAVLCREATILEVGYLPGDADATNSGYRIMLSCSDAGTWSGGRSYYLNADLGESGYATVLTAMSLDRTIKVYLASYAALSLIETVTVNPVP